jgi:hypothetical protein
MKTKMTAVASVLIIGLMLVGVSYAMWSKTLYVTGTVKTGTLDAQFTWWKWNSTWFDEYGAEHAVPGDKKTYTVDIYPLWVYPPGYYDFEYLCVDIDHFYPSIWLHIYFNITNEGTIPLIFQYYYIYSPPGYKVPGDLTLTGNVYGVQLETGQSVTGDVHVHLNNSALQNQPLGTYRFYVYIEAVQYNEFNATLGPTP